MVRDGSQAVIDKSSELINKTSELNQSIQGSMEQRQGSLQAIQDEVSLNQGLVDELFRLNEQYGGTTQAKTAMQPVIDNLNGKIAGLNLNIDEETGKLSMTREEILKVIESYKQQAQAAEAYKQIEQNTEDLSSATKNYNDLVANGQSIQEQQASILKELEEKYANVRSEQERSKMIVDEYAWRTNDLTKQQLDNNKALEDAAGKVNGLRDEQSQLIAQVSGEPAQAAEKVKADLYKAGGDGIQKYMDGINAKSPELNATADQVAQNAAGTAGSETNKMSWHTVGGSLGEALGWGYWSKNTDITAKADASAQNAANAIDQHRNQFSSIGGVLGGNYAGGLREKQGEAGNAGGALGQEAANRAGAIDMYGQGRAGGDSFASGLGSALQWISNIHIPAPHFVQTGSRKILGMSIPTFNVSWWSSGGIFPQRTLIGVGDRNNGSGNNAEAVIPLDQMYTRVENIFRRVTMEEQTINTPENRQQINITLPIYLNGEVIAKEMFTIVGNELAMTKRRVR